MIEAGPSDHRTGGPGLAYLTATLSSGRDAISARVGIETYPVDDPFAHVPGQKKAIRIATDTMGEIVAIGGASEPSATAAAALKDLEHILAARLSGLRSPAP